MAMNLKSLFMKANNAPEGSGFRLGRYIVCKGCNKRLAVARVRREYFICPSCGRYMTVRARRRILMLTDKRSFVEHDRDLTSRNVLYFPQYDEKLEAARANSRENEAVVCGTATIDGHPVCIFAMDANFMMGSMGAVVGEKITRLFEKSRIFALVATSVNRHVNIKIDCEARMTVNSNNFPILKSNGKIYGHLRELIYKQLIKAV